MRYRGPVGIILAVAVLVAGSAFYVFLGGGVTVTDTTVRGSQSVGQIAGDCEDVAMRDLFARVSIERDDYRRSLLGGQKTLTVTGTVDGETEQTTVTLEEIDRKTATLCLDSDIETSTLPRETKNVTIRVLDGDTVIHETTKTATLPRTEPGHAC